jgi:hypothetical protein
MGQDKLQKRNNPRRANLKKFDSYFIFQREVATL